MNDTVWHIVTNLIVLPTDCLGKQTDREMDIISFRVRLSYKPSHAKKYLFTK